jgi:hypothetical protein
MTIDQNYNNNENKLIHYTITMKMLKYNKQYTITMDTITTMLKTIYNETITTNTIAL